MRAAGHQGLILSRIILLARTAAAAAGPSARCLLHPRPDCAQSPIVSERPPSLGVHASAGLSSIHHRQSLQRYSAAADRPPARPAVGGGGATSWDGGRGEGDESRGGGGGGQTPSRRLAKARYGPCMCLVRCENRARLPLAHFLPPARPDLRQACLSSSLAVAQAARPHNSSPQQASERASEFQLRPGKV